jgi:hypothetical protein
MKTLKKTKLDLLLDVLSDHGWHWGEELDNKVGWRFGDSIYKARKKGYLIEIDQVGSRHRYRLLIA